MTVADSTMCLYNRNAARLEPGGTCNFGTAREPRDEDECNPQIARSGANGKRRVDMSSPDIHKIQHLVAAYTGLTALDLCSARRKPAHTRQLAMWLCRHATGHSLPAIGRAFGGRDHSTVAHAISRVDERMAADPAFSRIVNELLEDVA